MKQVLCTDCVTMTCAPTREVRLSVLRVDMSRAPTPCEVDVWATAMSEFARAHDGRLALRVGFVGPSVAAPDTMTWMAIAGRLLQMEGVVDARFKGCVVEVRNMDGTVIALRDLFETMYTTRHPFDVVGTPADADAFVEDLVVRAEEKRCRKAASKALRK